MSTPADYIVLTYDEENQLDAAAHFQAEPRKAFQAGKELAKQAASEKFRIFAVSLTPEGSLQFEPVER